MVIHVLNAISYRLTPLHFISNNLCYRNFEEKCFKGIVFPIDHNYQYYLDWKGYQSDLDIKEAENNYGKNELTIFFRKFFFQQFLNTSLKFSRLEMVVPEFMELFLERATAPFFVFQVFCVCLWCLDAYW